MGDVESEVSLIQRERESERARELSSSPCPQMSKKGITFPRGPASLNIGEGNQRRNTTDSSELLGMRSDYLSRQVQCSKTQAVSQNTRKRHLNGQTECSVSGKTEGLHNFTAEDSKLNEVNAEGSAAASRAHSKAVSAGHLFFDKDGNMNSQAFSAGHSQVYSYTLHV
jgi:hypothetical protein